MPNERKLCEGVSIATGAALCLSVPGFGLPYLASNLSAAQAGIGIAATTTTAASGMVGYNAVTQHCLPKIRQLSSVTPLTAIERVSAGRALPPAQNSMV